MKSRDPPRRHRLLRRLRARAQTRLEAHSDLQRFGLGIVASLRHADVLLFIGPVTSRMRHPLSIAHRPMPETVRAAALGDCVLGCNLLGTVGKSSARSRRFSYSTCASPVAHPRPTRSRESCSRSSTKRRHPPASQRARSSPAGSTTASRSHRRSRSGATRTPRCPFVKRTTGHIRAVTLARVGRGCREHPVSSYPVVSAYQLRQGGRDDDDRRTRRVQDGPAHAVEHRGGGLEEVAAPDRQGRGALLSQYPQDVQDEAWARISEAAREHAGGDGPFTLSNQALLAVGEA